MAAVHLFGVLCLVLLALAYGAVQAPSASPDTTGDHDDAKQEKQAAESASKLCTETLKQLPWESFQAICKAREQAAQSISDVRTIPSGASFAAYVDQIARAKADDALGKAFKTWTTSQETLYALQELADCWDGAHSMENQALFRLAPTYLNLQYEYEKRPPLARSNGTLAVRTKSELEKEISNSEFFKKMAVEGGEELLQSVVASLTSALDPFAANPTLRPSTTPAAIPPAADANEKALKALKSLPKMSPMPMDKWEPTDARDVLAAPGQQKNAKVLLETNSWTKLHHRLALRSRVINAGKCTTSCKAAVTKFAPAPKLHADLKNKAAAANNKFQAMMGGAGRTALAAVLMGDVRSSNLEATKIVSKAIMTFSHTKRVVRTFCTRLSAFLTWAFTNLVPDAGQWTHAPAPVLATFEAFIFGGFSTGTNGNAHGAMSNPHPDLASNSAWEQAYVGEIGAQVTTLAGFDEVCAEDNVRQTLSLIYRFAKSAKLGKLVELTTIRLNGGLHDPALTGGNIHFSAAHAMNQFNRQAANTEFCYNSWVTTPYPGVSGYLKYGCQWDALFYTPVAAIGDGVKRYRWPTMDDVVPPLSDKEMLYLYDGELNGVHGCTQCRKIDYLRRGHRRVPWRCGGDVALAALPENPMPATGGNAQGFQEWCSEAGMTARGGPSGSTDGMMHYGMYFSLNINAEDIVIYRNALAAWMELGGDHSFHEVMAAAEPFDLPYARVFDIYGWDQWSSLLFATITEVGAGVFISPDPAGINAAFLAHLRELNTQMTNGVAVPTFNCHANDYTQWGHVNRRASQWWWMNSYADRPAGVPALQFCIQPSPRRDIPVDFLPAAANAARERLGFLKVTAWDRTANHGVSIYIGFNPAAAYAPAAKLEPNVHAGFPGYQGACGGAAHQRACVITPTMTAFANALANGGFLQIALAHGNTLPAITNNNVGATPVFCVQVQAGGAPHSICSHNVIDITFLSRAIVTMQQSQAEQRSCRTANTFVLNTLAGSPDQRVGFYGPQQRFDVDSHSIQQNVVHWAKARAYICNPAVAHPVNPFTTFIRATARCGLAAADVTVRSADSVLESCTEGSLRSHSMACHFMDNVPLTCDTNRHWWRELAHRTAVCLYTHDEHYGQFRRAPVAASAWRPEAIDVMNDMARKPFSESYFPSYKDSLVFSGVKGKAQQWLREPIWQAVGDRLVEMDWRSYTRDPLLAWNFGNMRKHSSGDPEDSDTTMLVLINAPPASSFDSSPRARMIFQSYRIYDNQAEVLMPPMQVRVVAKRTYLCPTDRPLGPVPPAIGRSQYTRPVGPYTEVYLQFDSYFNYDGLNATPGAEIPVVN